jgi:Raf kinase inhibitor-like YbhB/YbcL family protein
MGQGQLVPHDGGLGHLLATDVAAAALARRAPPQYVTRMSRAAHLALATLLALLVACADGALEEPPMAAPSTLKLVSSAFAEGQSIPRDFTCDGANRSPPLAWSRAPAGTLSFALVMDDPDAPAGTWDHWLLWNLSGSALAEGATDGTSGANSWGKTGYGGPCPPSGTHRYVFRLLALDARLELPAGARKPALLEACKGHVLAEARLVGRYARG